MEKAWNEKKKNRETYIRLIDREKDESEKCRVNGGIGEGPKRREKIVGAIEEANDMEGEGAEEERTGANVRVNLSEAWRSGCNARRTITGR